MKASATVEAVVLQFPSMAKKPSEEVLPNRVREWRKRSINPATGKGFTLKEAAAKFGIAFSHLARIETGGRELSTAWMERIAATFGCAPADLLNPEMGGLSVEERELIHLLRNLPEANRRMIDAMLESQRAFLPAPEGADVIPISRKTG